MATFAELRVRDLDRALAASGCARGGASCRLKDLDIPQERIVKGDAKSLSIAAASIPAKTSRDAHMCRLDIEYPGYGFALHEERTPRA